MAPLDPNRPKPFEAGFEASFTKDTNTSGPVLNSHSNRPPNTNSIEDADKNHSRSIHIKQEIFEDEDEHGLPIVPTRSRAQNNQMATQLPAGPTNDVSFIGRFRGSIRRLLPLSQGADEENAYMHAAGNVGHQPVTVSTLLHHDYSTANNEHNPFPDVDHVKSLYHSQIYDISAKLANKEAHFQREIARLEGRNAEMSDRWVETERYYQRRIADLEVQNSKNASKAAAIQMQFDAACADFSKELAEAQSENSFKQVKATDTEIQGSWKDLSFLVRQFVKEHCPASFSPSMLQERHVVNRVPDLKHFCLNPILVLQSQLFAQSLLEMCIWGYLYKAIFDPHADYWAGKVGRNFISTCVGLQDLIARNPNSRTSSSSLPAFHQWRSDSMHQLDKLGAIKPPSSEAMAVKMLDYLAPILNHTPKGVPTSATATDAVEIMAAAANMDRIFRMSKAHYTVMISKCGPPFYPPFFGFPFDPNCMERKSEFAGFGDRNGSHPSDVDLVVSPAILKAGNTEGENYQSKQFLVKLGVVCNAQKFLVAAKKTQAKTSSTRQDAASLSTRTVRTRAMSSAERKRPSDGDDGSDVDMLDYPDNGSKRADL